MLLVSSIKMIAEIALFALAGQWLLGFPMGRFVLLAIARPAATVAAQLFRETGLT